MADEDLKGVYLAYCSFGGKGKKGQTMDGAKFAKFCRETKIQGKKVSSTEVDITFSKVKKGRVIEYEQFIAACRHLATRRFPKESEDDAFAHLKDLVMKHSVPGTTGTTKVKSGGVYSKLTDSSQYTGAHKARFNADGTGKGKLEDDGKIADLSQITRSNLNHVDNRMAEAEEREAAARYAFTKYDVNKNGTIEETELAKLLKDVGLDDADIHAEFESADSSHTGELNFETFVEYYNRLQQRLRGKAQRHARAKRSAGASGAGAGAGAATAGAADAADDGEPLDLKTVFLMFCRSGGQATATELDNAGFARVAKQCHLLKKGKVTTTDIDLIFSKAKARGGRRLNFAQFEHALELVASKLFPKRDAAAAVEAVHDHVIGSGGPIAKGTVANTGGIYSKLTDESKYTGAHKARFS